MKQKLLSLGLSLALVLGLAAGCAPKAGPEESPAPETSSPVAETPPAETVAPYQTIRLGLLNGRLLGGVVWGVWHWPLMLLVGYEYGTNYLGAPLLGLVVWCVVCFALNTLLDILYEKTESIWVPAIAHGAFNAVAALPQVLVTPADAYYNVLGPMPIGLIAALPMLAAAVWLTLREMKQEEKN